MEKKKKRTTEIIIILTLIIVAAVIIGYRMKISDKVVKEENLISELKAVRTSIELYLTLNKSYPENLKVLTTSDYSLGAKRSKYLAGVTVDKDDFPVDPWGKRFMYDSQDGRVICMTKGYDTW